MTTEPMAYVPKPDVADRFDLAAKGSHSARSPYLVVAVPRQAAPMFAAADLLLLTSRVEGLPLAVIEALATCCPVAATDAGDIGRIVRDGANGCLGSANDPSSLVEPIAAIAADPESWRRLRAAARTSVLSSPYRLTAMTAAYEALLL